MRLIPTTIDLALSQTLFDRRLGAGHTAHYKRDKRGSLDRERLSG